MNTTKRHRRRTFRLGGILLLLSILVAALPGSVQAAGTTISIIYPATKAAFDAWNATTSTARPPRTDAFRSGTTIVTFYFEYEGATANKTQYKLIIRHRLGPTFVTHGPYVFTHRAGLHMSPVQAPGGHAYPDGAYHVDLLVDGKVTASTGFTVGAVSHDSAQLSNVRVTILDGKTKHETTQVSVANGMVLQVHWVVAHVVGKPTETLTWRIVTPSGQTLYSSSVTDQATNGAWHWDRHPKVDSSWTQMKSLTAICSVTIAGNTQKARLDFTATM